MTRAFAAVVAFTAAVSSVFGALGLWLLGKVIDKPQSWPGIFGFIIAVDATIVAVVALLYLRSRGDGSIVEGIRRASAEATPVSAGFLGAAIALPVCSLHGAFVTDTDSQRILASLNFVSRHGPRYLLRNQDQLLPQLLFRPMLAIGGQSGVRVVPIVGAIFLAAVMASLAFSITRRVVGAVVAAIVVISMRSILNAAAVLPMYELTLAFGYLGGWFAYKALRTSDNKTLAKYAIGTAIAIALAVESQGTGQLFILAPALVIGCFATRKTLRHDARVAWWVYFAMGVTLLPRLIINLWIGGIHHVSSTRNEFMVTQGYLRIVNADFWKYPVNVGPLKYLTYIPGMGRDAIGLGLGTVMVVVLVGAALFSSTWRSRIFVVVTAGVFALALAKAQPPPFDRYTSPLLPGVALLAAVGAVQLLRRGNAVRIGALASVLIITAAGMIGFPQTATQYRAAQFALLHSNAALIRPLISDHRGVIGVRASKLEGLDPKIPTWGTPFLTEKEWKTFLLWPSDKAVLEMMQRHNIGWVVILADYSLEVQYNNTWTQRAYGKPVRMWTKLFTSDNFCNRFHYGFSALFEVGPCTADTPEPLPGQTTPPTTAAPAGASAAAIDRVGTATRGRT